MNKKIHKVGIVLDPNFGEKLIPLLKRMHVWFLDSDENKQIIEKHKNVLDKVWSKTDITDPFDLGMSLIPVDTWNKELFSDLIEEIECHQGEFHHNPPWSIIEVYGIVLSFEIEKILKEYGVIKFKKIKNGFIAYK